MMFRLMVKNTELLAMYEDVMCRNRRLKRQLAKLRAQKLEKVASASSSSVPVRFLNEMMKATDSADCILSTSNTTADGPNQQHLPSSAAAAAPASQRPGCSSFITQSRPEKNESESSAPPKLVCGASSGQNAVVLSAALVWLQNRHHSGSGKCRLPCSQAESNASGYQLCGIVARSR